MSTLPGWQDLIDGKECPFCAPRPDDDGFNIKVADLGVSTLYLDHNQVHRGYSVLIFKKRHVTGIEHLSTEEYTAFMQDLKRAADALYKAVQPDHMNYATLGNVIPHLHYHLIPRYKDAERWGAPVWTSSLAEMSKKNLDLAEYAALIAGIKKHL